MSELGKPKEFSAHATRSGGRNPRMSKGAVIAALAALFLLAVLVAVSGCVPTP